MYAQEIVIPLSSNPTLFEYHPTINTHKKNRNQLPFIEDFSYEGPYPNASIWLDSQVYINNTMPDNPINRGVATFDGLNQWGRPYFKDPLASGTADSLTSKPFNFSIYTPANNIYLSFFYQPQGLGFAPESGDSLLLFFKNQNQDWIRVWETRGTPLQPFKIALIPITDTQFLHNNFQFRFVNIASLNTNDDIWNIDYIKIDVNRNAADSIMNDVGFTKEPTSILKNYSSLPYRHFLVNKVNELSSSQTLELRNTYIAAKNITVHHEATELLSATFISNNTLSSVTIGGKSSLNQSNPSFQINYNSPNTYDKVVIRNKYFIDALPGDRKENDTIIANTIFDNYFSYDDGSAEKSYFLLPAANFPSKTALEFTLNQGDSLRGLMVHFGAQVPTALGKYFSIVLYKKLHGIGNSDEILYQQDFYQVKYEPTINGFTTYAFDTAKYLDAGTYYIGIMQPANFGSDSIYYGLDVNNNTNHQHLWYNVDGTWYASGIQGSLMMRPIVGLAFTPTSISESKLETNPILLFPNPADDKIFIQSIIPITQVEIFDTRGVFIQKQLINRQEISLQNLPIGNYILVLKNSQNQITTHQIFKK